MVHYLNKVNQELLNNKLKQNIMTLVKFNPRNGQLRRQDDSIFNYSDLWNSIFNDEYKETGISSPKVNIKEEEEMFELEMAIPGLSKKEIQITMNSDILKISHSSADQKLESEFSHREFGYYNFERSFKLPDSIDLEKIDAKMENGILTIKLPKKEEAIDKGPKEIKIS